MAEFFSSAFSGTLPPVEAPRITEGLKAAIDASGKSRNAVMRELGLSSSHFYRIMRGATLPGAELLAEFCRVTGSSADVILGLRSPGEPEAPAPPRQKTIREQQDQRAADWFRSLPRDVRGLVVRIGDALKKEAESPAESPAAADRTSATAHDTSRSDRTQSRKKTAGGRR